MNFNDWWHDTENKLSIPHTTRNARVGIAWMYTESGDPDGYGRGGRWNPMNTTWRLTASQAPSGIASWSFNSVGVQNYATFADGQLAFLNTIRQTNSQYGYVDILRHFRASSRPHKTLGAIEHSAWGTGGLILLVYRDIKNGAYWPRAHTLVNGS